MTKKNKNKLKREKMKGVANATKYCPYCGGKIVLRSADGIYAEYVKKEGIMPRADQYPMFAVMIKNLLQSLVEDGRIRGVYDNHRLVYELK